MAEKLTEAEREARLAREQAMIEEARANVAAGLVIQDHEVDEWLDRFVRRHTVNRFGPVREVERKLVLEVAFDSIHESRRHKSGLAMRFPRVSRIRTDKPAAEADTIAALRALVT